MKILRLLAFLLVASAAFAQSNSVIYVVRPATATGLWVYYTSLEAGATGTANTITVNGSNFTSKTVILYDGVAVPTTYVSKSQLKFTQTAAEVSVAGSHTISVMNPVATAPTIATQPVSKTVTVSQTATFSVVASGTAPFSYQWSKTGVVIAGATAASYTTPATVATDNGSSFSVVVTNSGGSITSSSAVLTVNPLSGYQGKPYLVSPVALPGVVEAANYDIGGQGVAYNVINASNQGGAYRPTELVSLEPTTDSPTTAQGDGYDVGWINPSEWENYSVTSTGGPFTMTVRVAALGQGGTFHVECPVGTNITGSLTIPNTGAWQTYTTLTAPVTLPAGNQVLRVVWDTAVAGVVGNLHWIQVAPVGTVVADTTWIISPANQTVNPPYPLSIQYHAVGNNTGNDVTNSVTWTSSNPALASIGAGGAAQITTTPASTTQVTISATK